VENLLIIGCGDVARRAPAGIAASLPGDSLLGALAPRGRGAMLPRRFVYLSNRRMKAELGVRLRYSTVQDGVPGMKETA